MRKSFLRVITLLFIFLLPSLVLAETPDHARVDSVQVKESLIREELNKIKDPETGGPLPSFVLIDRIVVEGAKVSITVRIPPYCPFKEVITKLIKERIVAMEGIDVVEVVSMPKKMTCPVKKSKVPLPAVISRSITRLPRLSLASVKPEKVYPGDVMSVSVKVKDPAGVASVSANMGDVETVALVLKKGTTYNGIWEAVWKVHGTQQKNYVTTLKATNSQGSVGFTHVGWSDPVAWWDNAYLYRRQITVVNNTAAVLPTGFTVWATLRTSVSNMQADGDDIRIVYWNGAAHVELDRHPRYLNSPAVELYFKTQADISGNGGDSNYYIYYSNASASNPPANGSNVYEYWEPFDDLTGWLTLYGTPSAAGGIVSLSAGTAINHDTGFLGNVYNKVFEQYVRSDLSGNQAMWWGEQFRLPTGSWFCGYQCCDGADEGWKDLILVTSVVNAVRKNSLTGIANNGLGMDEARSSSWAPGNGYNVYTQKWKANEVKHYYNQTFWATHAVDVSTPNFNVFMQLWNYSGSTGVLMADWFAVRPYVDPEPSTTMGAQEGPESRVGGASIGGAVMR